MPLKRLIKFLTSLRLTVVLLAFAILLVFVGTVAQADEGLYNAQTRYFKQWVVMGVTLFGHRVPAALPGGYLIGTLLLANLVAAHIQRFQFTWKKLGIHVAHGGIILLLVGQLTTDIFSHEATIRFAEGETKAYAESASNYELIFSTSADENSNEEVVLPARLLARGGEVKNASLPLTIRVKEFWKNSEPSFRAPMLQNGPALTTNGIGAQFDFHATADVKKMDDRNIPSAVVELSGANGPLGTWVVSGWTTPDMADALKQGYASMGGQMANTIASRITQPQTVAVNGKKYSFALRPERIYYPFSLTLLRATHSVYPGTDIPKDFRSRVRLANASTGENREVEIFMNNPLRYGGLTFYQYQMAAAELVRAGDEAPWSVLQVVRNPSWFTPYVGCCLVAAGLVIQFLSHLIGFISKRKPSVAGRRAPGAERPKTARAESDALPTTRIH